MLPIIPQDDPELEKVLNEIERLTNILGKEMSDLETQLTKGPGRPRKVPDITQFEKALAEAEAEAPRESPTEREARVKFKIEQLRKKVETEQPEVLALKRSEDALNEMIKLGGDKHEGSNETTHVDGEVAGDTERR